MDEAGADRRGIAPLRPMLEQLAAVTDKPTLAAVTASLQRQGVRGPFTIRLEGQSPVVSADDRMPEVQVFHLEQGGLSLPDRDYYLKQDPELLKARQADHAYASTLLTLAGEPHAVERATAVLAFEGRIAAAHWSRTRSREAEQVYNRWRPADFATKAPGFAWDRYLGALGVDKQSGILVAQPSAFTDEARIWAETPLAVLKDHQLLQLLDHYAPFLSKPFVDANFHYHGSTLAGSAENEPRPRRGTELVSELMSDSVGQEYVRRYFPPATRKAAQELVRNVIAAWHERLGQVSWMAPATRLAAQRKLAAMGTFVGHTDHWRDYGDLTIARDDLIGNVRRSYEAEYRHQLAKLDHPTERDDWGMTAMEADALNEPTLNSIYLPAGVFQPPYFDPAADPAANYGGIGTLISHEISHSFDDQGRKYDAAGRLVDWWTPQDVRGYQQRTAKLVQQYDAYEPLPGQHIQGAFVLGETMADLGGLIASHRAYHLALDSRPAPVLGGFTGEQRFYIAFAQMWRMKYRPAELRKELLSDPHPPGEQRADTVRNRPEWYQAFSVKPGDRLYLSPDQRVDVW